MPNRFAHTELSTTNVAAAKEFYAKLFDWKLEDLAFGAGTYTMVSSGGRGIGGIQSVAADARPAWLPYVEVVDVRKTLDAARAAGATIVVDYQEVGANGAIGVFLDPAGAALGVWAPKAKASEEDEKKKRKAEKQARKAAKRAEEKLAKKDEKQAKKARKAAKKRAEKARKEAERETPSIVERPRTKRPAKKKAAAKPRKPTKRRGAAKR